MNNYFKRGICIAVCCTIILLTCSGCASLLKEYHPDICIPLEDCVGEIVIKEWVLLLTSGAEIYYRVGFIELELGKLDCGNDGDCPFKDGRYSVTANGNQVTIKWDFYARHTDNEKLWETETFEIPEFKDWWKYL